MVLKWNKNIESVIEVMEKQCRLYKKMHMEISISKLNKYSALSMTAMILSPLPAFFSILGLTLQQEMIHVDTIFDSISLGISLITTILVGVTKFGKYDEISYSHKTASSQYTSLEQNIKRQLMLERSERIAPKIYLTWIMKKFDILYESSPLLSCSTSKKYEKTIELLEKEYQSQEHKIHKNEDTSSNSDRSRESIKEKDDEEDKMYKIDIEKKINESDLFSLDKVYKDIEKSDDIFFTNEQRKKKSRDFSNRFNLSKFDDEQMIFELQR
jgi:hypothetical protein